MMIALCYSMQFAEKAKEVSDWFHAHGHTAYTSVFNNAFLGKTDEEKEKIKLKQKYEQDAIREHWDIIKISDAILVLNYEKNGVKNYIGGNAFLEMGFAYLLKKPIYLLHDIPHMPYYETEIIGMKPIIINGDLEKLLKNEP
jgi:hypothetical protein